MQGEREVSIVNGFLCLKGSARWARVVWEALEDGEMSGLGWVVKAIRHQKWWRIRISNGSNTR